MTQQDASLDDRLSQIEARLSKIEEVLFSARAEKEQEAVATFFADADSMADQRQKQCYDAWIHYLNNNPEAVEAHLSVHETAALKASINAQAPSDS